VGDWQDIFGMDADYDALVESWSHSTNDDVEHFEHGSEEDNKRRRSQSQDIPIAPSAFDLGLGAIFKPGSVYLPEPLRALLADLVAEAIARADEELDEVEEVDHNTCSFDISYGLRDGLQDYGKLEPWQWSMKAAVRAIDRALREQKLGIPETEEFLCQFLNKYCRSDETMVLMRDTSHQSGVIGDRKPTYIVAGENACFFVVLPGGKADGLFYQHYETDRYGLGRDFCRSYEDLAFTRPGQRILFVSKQRDFETWIEECIKVHASPTYMEKIHQSFAKAVAYVESNELEESGSVYICLRSWSDAEFLVLKQKVEDIMIHFCEGASWNVDLVAQLGNKPAELSLNETIYPSATGFSTDDLLGLGDASNHNPFAFGNDQKDNEKQAEEVARLLLGTILPQNRFRGMSRGQESVARPLRVPLCSREDLGEVSPVRKAAAEKTVVLLLCRLGVGAHSAQAALDHHNLDLLARLLKPEAALDYEKTRVTMCDPEMDVTAREFLEKLPY